MKRDEMICAQCTLCSKGEEPGFYNGCLLNDGHDPQNMWTCDGAGNLTRPVPLGPITWWQRLLCRLMCPQFAEAYPPDAPGTWQAVALVVYSCGSRREKSSVPVEGLRNAYEQARWLALKLDWVTPSGLGIDWAIRKASIQTKTTDDN